MGAGVELQLRIRFNRDVWTKFVSIPQPFWPEARRREASPPSPDGHRYCLNRCCHPFYAWVREQVAAWYPEARRAYLADRPWIHPEDFPETWDESLIIDHPHPPASAMAPHWFEPLLAHD